MLDNKIANKLRKIQSDRIKITSSNVSFSKIINSTLENAWKCVV